MHPPMSFWSKVEGGVRGGEGVRASPRRPGPRFPLGDDPVAWATAAVRNAYGLVHFKMRMVSFQVPKEGALPSTL